jgi:dihydrofolate reductase
MSQIDASGDPLPAPRVHLIAAVATNGVIGAAGGMPWHLPEDLRHLKRTTMGHPVIMGRRTWESVGRALPGRENFVVTRQSRYAAPGARIAESLESALAACAGHPVAFVLGGAELYRAALPLASAMVLTEIRREYSGDTFFPGWDRDQWREQRRETHHTPDGLEFDFAWYERLPAAAG